MPGPRKTLALLTVLLFPVLLVTGCGREGQDTANDTAAIQPTAEQRSPAPLPSLTTEEKSTIISRVDEMISVFFEDRRDIIECIQALTPLIDLVKEHPQLNEDYGLKLELCGIKASLDDIPIMKKYLDGPIDAREREITLYFLTVTTFVNGDVDSGRSFHFELSKEYPDGIFAHMFSEEDVALMDRACREKRAILSQTLPEDERLWRLGKLYMETMELSWNTDGIVYDLSYGCAMLARIIKDYPKSKRVDDAMFELITLDEIYNHEDGDEDPSCPRIADYERLITKYPESEYVPEAKLAIAEHYAFSGDIAYLDKARALVEEVLANCPSEECREKALQISQSIEEASESAREASQAERTSP